MVCVIATGSNGSLGEVIPYELMVAEAMERYGKMGCLNGEYDEVSNERVHFKIDYA